MKIIQIAALLLVSSSAYTQNYEEVIIPRPQIIELKEGSAKQSGEYLIKTKSQLFKPLQDSWNGIFSEGNSNKKTRIKIIQSKNIKNPEAYELAIRPGKIKIKASNVNGAFYALQSLSQLETDRKLHNKTTLPIITITDSPRYSWRGLMLDESRHFFGKEQVKQLLDMMALQKLNTFHWHLTDEPGWRIEIKKYPNLTKIGAKGNFSNPEAGPQFYTQEDIKEIVKYAADRSIQIIPEIDMPGHATAANKAYPEYSGGGNEKHPDFTFHPGKESTYSYLTNILREVAQLFPSPYIHIGGDEVHFGNDKWANDPDVKNLMARENLKDIKEVEFYFLKRISDSLKVLNKTMLGWDEVVPAGLSTENTIVMWWRHDKPETLKASLDAGYRTILCPRLPLYFDFVQYDGHKDGRRWNGFAPLENVYAFPNSELTGGVNFENKLVLGLQANVWTERMQNKERLQFMIYPRMSALAEAGWTNYKRKDFNNFENRLKKMTKIYQMKGLTYFDVFNPESQKEILGPEKKK